MLGFRVYATALLFVLASAPPVCAAPPAFSTTTEGLQKGLENAQLETLGGGFQAVFSDEFVPTVDPFYKQNLSQAAYLYLFRREPKRSGWFPVVTVHFTPEDRLMAQQSLRLCARLLRLHREKFGSEAVFPRASDMAHVWLCPNPAPHSPKAGGETRSHHVYVWATTATARSPLEWVRTVAHEWGHLTLPAARGFTAPENDAAGYLGERLFLRWMANEQANLTPDPNDGTTQADLNHYTERQALPLAQRFRDGGPLHERMRQKGADAMDYYTGCALAFEDGFGPRLLGQALFSVDGPQQSDLLLAMNEAVGANVALTVRLPAWVPFSKTMFTLSSDVAGPVAIADRPALSLSPSLRVSLPVRVAGWKWVRAESGPVRTVTFKRSAPLASNAQ